MEQTKRFLLASPPADWRRRAGPSNELYWLDVPEPVVHKLGVMVFNCLHGQAPPYLVELCQPVAGVASPQHLWSATRQLLVVSRHRLFLCGWPIGLEFPAGQLAQSNYWWENFRQSLKTFLFATYWCIQHIRGFTTMHYINRLFSYFYLLVYASEAAALAHWVASTCRPTFQTGHLGV